MTNYRCLIVDDEPLARQLLESHLSNLVEFEIVASCSSAIEAQQLLNQTEVDLMFLDIEMPVLKGTEFYQNLRNKPKVIFTTAYRDYAIEGFELEAVDYLLKPIVFSRFFKAIEKFKASQELMSKMTQPQEEEVEKQYLFVRENRKQVKLILSQIYYIQGLKDYLKIITTSGSHIVKSTLSGFEQQLPSQFLRIHRSFIINKDHVTAYNRHEVEIEQHEIPIGESYRTLFPI
ncbi:LytR/AlgR family response regulator transcription factor [Aliikangiella sp. IMCC44653]